VSNDLRDLDGPPYGVVESVFDEYDRKDARLSKKLKTSPQRIEPEEVDDRVTMTDSVQSPH